MLREIGVAVPLLIILTIAVILGALSQTTELGPVATGGIGVTDETALAWGQNAELAGTEDDETIEVTEEATEEATEAVAEETEEATATDEADDEEETATPTESAEEDATEEATEEA